MKIVYWILGIVLVLGLIYVFAPPFMAWDGDNRSLFQKWMGKESPNKSPNPAKN